MLLLILGNVPVRAPERPRPSWDDHFVTDSDKEDVVLGSSSSCRLGAAMLCPCSSSRAEVDACWAQLGANFWLVEQVASLFLSLLGALLPQKKW